MRKNKFLPILLTILLIISMLPVSAFAAAGNTLGGTVKITGDAVTGSTLKADLSKVTPSGIKESDLDFKWMKKTEKDNKDKEKDTEKAKEEEPLGKESSLKLTKEMVGLSVVLVISPKEDSAIQGSALTSEAVKIQEKTDDGENVEDLNKDPAPSEPSASEEPVATETPGPVPEEPEPAGPLMEVALPTILTETLPGGIQGTNYVAQLEAQSEEAVTWSMKEGNVLPEGLVIDQGGMIGGKITAEPGQYSFTVTAANTGGSVERTLSITVEAPAVYSMTASPAALDFGSASEGYKTVDPQKITLTNTGNQSMSFKEMTSVNYQVQGKEGGLGAGEQLTLTVSPKSGLSKGTYQESLTFLTEEGVQASVSVSFTVTEKEEKIYEIVASPAVYDFGQKETGYDSLPDAAEITVTNTGNQTVTLEQPVAKDFQITQPTALVLAPGEEARFSIQPKKELQIGLYEENIDISTDSVAGAVVTAKFQVTGAKLLSVIQPSAITGLTNGIEKTVNAFGLPGTVEIKTNAGGKKAVVDWDVASCAYDPSSVDAQNFTVQGKITLPDQVENPDGISLTAQIQVSVKAYVPRVPDTSELKINNLSSNSTYKTNTSISFSATGAGNNSSPRKGDVRYIPYAWKLGNSSYTEFADSNYSTSLKAANAGTYTLSVSYRRDVYNGSEWKADGTLAYKEMNLKFIKDTVSITPAAKNTTQKKAVATGDETNIMGWIVLGAVGLAVVIGVGTWIIYRRKDNRQ